MRVIEKYFEIMTTQFEYTPASLKKRKKETESDNFVKIVFFSD